MESFGEKSRGLRLWSKATLALRKHIAWLKRRLFNCVGKYPKEMELVRHATTLEELFLTTPK